MPRHLGAYGIWLPASNLGAILTRHENELQCCSFSDSRCIIKGLVETTSLYYFCLGGNLMRGIRGNDNVVLKGLFGFYQDSIDDQEEEIS